MNEILEMIKALLKQIPWVEKLLEIKGITEKTVAGFLAEVGDVRRFTDAKQTQKYAGLSMVENSSGKGKGKTKISKRDRKRLSISCKLIRVFYTLLTKDAKYDT